MCGYFRKNYNILFDGVISKKNRGAVVRKDHHAPVSFIGIVSRDRTPFSGVQGK